jgi:acetyltransferase
MHPASRTDPFLHSPHVLLNALFAPKNVVVIGATERPGSVGRALMWRT